MPSDFSKYSGAIFAALLLWMIYRRVRRSFVRQPVSPKRMSFRVIFLSVIGLFVIAATFATLSPRSLPLAGAVLLGLGSGVLLALWGASQTRFERDGATLYFVPHTYSGLAVTALFLGRIAYRFVQFRGADLQSSAPDGFGQFTASYGRSPLTLGFFFVVVGYYVCFYSLLLYKARHLDDAAGKLAGTPETGDSSKPA